MALPIDSFTKFKLGNCVKVLKTGQCGWIHSMDPSINQYRINMGAGCFSGPYSEAELKLVHNFREGDCVRVDRTKLITNGLYGRVVMSDPGKEELVGVLFPRYSHVTYFSPESLQKLPVSLNMQVKTMDTDQYSTVYCISEDGKYTLRTNTGGFKGPYYAFELSIENKPLSKVEKPSTKFKEGDEVRIIPTAVSFHDPYYKDKIFRVWKYENNKVVTTSLWAGGAIYFKEEDLDFVKQEEINSNGTIKLTTNKFQVAQRVYPIAGKHSGKAMLVTEINGMPGQVRVTSRMIDPPYDTLTCDESFLSATKPEEKIPLVTTKPRYVFNITAIGRNTPAEQYQLQPGDTILELNGQEFNQFSITGEYVKLLIDRKGTKMWFHIPTASAESFDRVHIGVYGNLVLYTPPETKKLNAPCQSCHVVEGLPFTTLSKNRMCMECAKAEHNRKYSPDLDADVIRQCLLESQKLAAKIVGVISAGAIASYYIASLL